MLRRRLRLAAIVAVVLFPLFISSGPRSDEPAILVVDVAAPPGAVDAAGLREAIGHELGVTSVEPDDPRAAAATGRVEVQVNATDKKLAVRYRKLGAIVAREVDLPQNRATLSSTAVLIAGNLARDEARALIDAMKKPG